MSLSGSVEDLPLLEILQVVSFCQKTGHLLVRSPDGEAAVVFDSGRVVAGFAWDVPPLPPGEPPPGDQREKAVRGRIERVLGRLVRLRDGDFAFKLSQQVPASVGGRDLSAEMLAYGINPEELMLDLAKTLDEDRRDATAVLEASFVTPPSDEEPALEELQLEEAPPEPETAPEAAPETAAAPAAAAPRAASAAGRPVLVVDDEPDVCRVLAERLEAAGFAVVTAQSAADARAEMHRLAARGGAFLLVADVGLPGEGSFRGGLDVARYASGLASPPPVLLMAETIDEKLRRGAKRAGASLLSFKPGISKLDPLQYEADLRAFGDKLARDLVPRLEGRAPQRRSMARPPFLPDVDRAARETALQAALAELGGRPDPDMVAFLLLRTARAFFPRVVLFLVRDERLRGLAGNGPLANGESLDLLARELAVPLRQASPFAEAVAFGRPWTGPLPEAGPLFDLVGRLGRLGATAAAVLPVRAQHETIAVVYGDSPGGVPLPDLAPLVAFTEQAGRALDNALAGRREPSELAC